VRFGVKGVHSVKRSLAVLVVLALGGCVTPLKPAYDDARVKSLASPSLEKFESESAFVAYLREVRRLARARGMWWGLARGPQYAQAQTTPQEVPCPQGVTPPCYSDGSEAVTVTGSRIASPPASITNVQMRGVDEGDIVKQFRHFLVVLQDGRLFVADTRPGGQSGLALVDRANVYRSNKEDTWYDEMLIHDDRIVVVGYSYDRAAAEFSVFAIDARGRLAREATYYISAADYYSGNNYATRLVDDRLIIRTSLELRDIDPETPIKWPLIRRWQREGEGEAALSAGTRIYGAREIYRPVQATLEPTLETVSVCPLGKAHAGDELACRTTAFIASGWAVYFVSREHAYLWATPGYDDREGFDKGPACDARSAAFEHGVPGALFRVPLDGGAMRFLRVRGDPNDQFSLDVDSRAFRALLMWNATCDDWRQPLAVKYFRTPVAAFGVDAKSPRARDYLSLPAPDATHLENRFTERALVYSGRKGWSSYPPDADEGQAEARVVAVPIEAPEKPTVLSVPHNVIRIESIGKAAVLTGYKDDQGLSISLIDAHASARRASTVVLAQRYESEGRSHAYNAAIEADGSGIMGVPTVKREGEAGRYYWRSDASDVSFLALVAERQLRLLGELEAREKAQHPAYNCEVSCIDWYGNTRPIFTDGRVFALAATEIVEGRVHEGRILEIGRLNLTAPPAK
jgi:hypothetical protein